MWESKTFCSGAVGDYNQRIPRHGTPVRVHDELLETFAEPWTICTAGELEGAESRAIDHVAHSDGLSCTSVRVLPSVTEEGLRLSDHIGVVVELDRTRPRASFTEDAKG